MPDFKSIVLVRGADLDALYFDGTLRVRANKIEETFIYNNLVEKQIEFTIKHIDPEWINNMLGFPNKLDDIPEDKLS